MKIRTKTDTGEWTTRRYLSLLGSLLIWAIVAVDAWYLWPTQLHGSTSMVIVSGHSMEPTYFTGDLVIARKTTPSIGDVIVYSPKGLGGSQIVHRIIGGNATDGWQMQGDNNDFVDPFTPKGNEVKGVVLVHYANFGRVTVLLLNPIIWALVLLTAIVLLVWWGGDTCEDEPTDDDEGGGSDGESQDQGGASGGGAADASRAPPGDSQAAKPSSDLHPQGAKMAIAKPDAGGLRSLVTAKRGIAVALVSVLAMGFSVTPASASGLIVNTKGSTAVLSYAHCDNLTLAAAVAGTATGSSYTKVTVTGVTAKCAGLPMTVTVYNSAGAVLTTGSGTSVANTQTFNVASYNASQVVSVIVTLRGWVYMASWAPPIPTFPAVGSCDGVVMNTGQVVTGVACTLNVTTQSVNLGGVIWFYLQVSASTAFNPSGYMSSSGWVNYQDITLWRYTVDLEALPSAGWMGNLDDKFYLYKNGNNTALATGEDCSDPHSITFQEEVAGSNPSSNFIVSPEPISWMQPANLLCQGP